MFGPKKLDEKNTYNPNLQDIQESAERTYGEADTFFEMVEMYLKNLELKIDTLSEKEIYDKCNTIASDLAKCCEMFLKAIYIYENNVLGNSVDEIWTRLKAPGYKVDSNGNPIYLLEGKNGKKIYTYIKVDSNGNRQLDSNGKTIYFDMEGNIYSEGTQGKKIKVTGHELDRLIQLLSPDSRLLLETRMLTIPMGITEKYSSVSILDLLKNKGIIKPKEEITHTEYLGWVEQHKKTFEEARYSGEKQHDISVEFLYHLTTQIRAVAQYKLDPKNNQKFSITEEDLKQLPKEMQDLASYDENLLSEDLIKLIATNNDASNKLIKLISQKYIKYLCGINSNTFFQVISELELSEIIYVCYICYISENCDKLYFANIQGDDIKKDIFKKIFTVSATFKKLNFNRNQIVSICIRLKLLLKMKIDLKLFIDLFDALKLKNVYDPNTNLSNYLYNNNDKVYGDLINEENYHL